MKLDTLDFLKGQERKMIDYKCRVETPKCDVRRIKRRFKKEGITCMNSKLRKGEGLPCELDWLCDEWSFSSKTSLDMLRLVMNSVIDAHVAVETLEKKKNYSGDRKKRYEYKDYGTKLY